LTAARKHDGTGLTTHETKQSISDASEARRFDALSPHHTLKSSDAWKAQKKIWLKANDTQRKSYLYAMVLFDGVAADTKRGMALIARFFSINVKELEPYKDVINMADAARVLKINRNQLGTSLGRDDQVNLKFFMGKQFAYQVTDPAHEGVESIDDGKDITINVLTKEDQQSSQEDEHATDAPEESPVTVNTLLN
jgi:hypothetical protein